MAEVIQEKYPVSIDNTPLCSPTLADVVADLGRVKLVGKRAKVADRLARSLTRELQRRTHA
jgi:hypothetical protein